MPASQQASRTRGLIYFCLLALACAGAAVRIGFMLWENARANEQVQNTKPQKYNLDWIKEYTSLQAPPPRMSGLHPCIYESLQESSGPKLGQCGSKRHAVNGASKASRTSRAGRHSSGEIWRRWLRRALLRL